jgi:hypothetical protein
MSAEKRIRMRAVGLAACLLLALSGLAHGQTEDDKEEDIELERTVELEAELITVEPVPTLEASAIARFRIVDGQYRGSTFTLAYVHERPVRLRSWDVHDPSGYRRIGGARVTEPPLGQWDALLRPGTHEPVHTLFLTLIQHDLNEDEEDRRWHFKAIESIAPVRQYDALDAMRSRREQAPPLPPDR